MKPRLTTDYAKNYCNRTLIVKVIVENVVTCFYGTQCRPNACRLISRFVVHAFSTSFRKQSLTNTIMPENFDLPVRQRFYSFDEFDSWVRIGLVG